MNYSYRQKKLIELLKDESLDAFLVRKKENIAYLTGSRGEDAVLFVYAKGSVLITDSRYEEEYKKYSKKCSVRIAKNKSLWETVLETCIESHAESIGFESDNFTYKAYAYFKKSLGSKKLIPLASAVESLRILKDRGEIQYITRACKYGSQLMNYATEIIRPGISENSVKRMIESYALNNDISIADFDIIVASGTNASMPHSAVSERRIKREEMVIVDLGAMYFSYNSDLTRTVFLGKINPKYLQAYKIVLASQVIAIENLKPGVYAKDIDAISRRYISDKGMGRFFLHSLGHGIGREIHELPAISQSSKIKLEKDMVITIEPGIYIPGWGGIRIEDTVLITENGCEVLTKGAVKHAGRN